jgi:cyanate permease
MAMAYVQETGEDIPDDMKHLLATAMVARVGQTLRPAMGEVLSILTSLTGETELQTTFVDLLEEMQKEGAARKAKLN